MHWGRPWLQFFISCKASTVPGLVQHCCHHYLGGFPAAKHQPVKVHAAYRKRNKPPTTSTLTCWVSSLNSSARPCQSQGSGLVTVWAGVLRRFWKVPSKQIRFSSICSQYVSWIDFSCTNLFADIETVRQLVFTVCMDHGRIFSI